LIAAAIILGLSVSGAAAAAPPTDKGHAAKAENDKKPGKSCDNAKQGTAAYKDCVAAAAHDGKTPPAKGKDKDKDKKKGPTG
jgi:hypothetical protein